VAATSEPGHSGGITIGTVQCNGEGHDG
jgi:hypothetical protein